MSNSSEAIGQTTTPGKRSHSKILVDSGDPQETTRIRQLIGFVDGQTTNRSPANEATWRLSRPRSPPRECAASDLALDSSTSCVAASYRHRSTRHLGRLRSKQDHWERERQCARPA